MRGSIYYQSATLAKAIFQPGAKKHERIDPEHENFQKVSSYRTMEAYRDVWNNLFKYVKGNFGIDDMLKIDNSHIVAYMEWKVQCGVSKQYLEQISAAIGKLYIAKHHLAATGTQIAIVKEGDFSVRQEILDIAREYEQVKDGYHNRAYKDPEAIIKKLSSHFALAASIALEGGARLEGVTLIQRDQLLGINIDSDIDMGISTSKFAYKIMTKEKGGKEGVVNCSKESYDKLKTYIRTNKVFKINREGFLKEVREACKSLGVEPEGVHGFRWCFAQRRYLEYQRNGYTTEQSLQAVSSEMKHNRASITNHYLHK